MTSGFVTTKELTEEKQARQDAWEKVRKPTDNLVAPEPEYCNKTLFEQLKDNKDAKQLEIDEAKKLKNMVRGIDEDESVFLSHLDTTKREIKSLQKKEEEEVIKEMTVIQHLAAKPQSSLRFSLKPSTSTESARPISKQAQFLSTAIKRKSRNSTDEKKEEPVPVKVSKPEPVITQVGTFQSLCNYGPSSDSESSNSSDDDDDDTIPTLVTSKPEKKSSGGSCE